MLYLDINKKIKVMNKIKELQDKFKWLSKRTNSQLKEESKQEEDEIIDISDHDGIGNAVDNLNNEPPQETLEEAAFRLYPINFIIDYDTNEEIRDIWINGAKWQQQRMYSEEEVLELMYKAFEAGFKKYDVVDAGLEGLETDIECNWILKKYSKI